MHFILPIIRYVDVIYSISKKIELVDIIVIPRREK